MWMFNYLLYLKTNVLNKYKSVKKIAIPEKTHVTRKDRKPIKETFIYIHQGLPNNLTTRNSFPFILLTCDYILSWKWKIKMWQIWASKAKYNYHDMYKTSGVLINFPTLVVVVLLMKIHSFPIFFSHTYHTYIIPCC